VMDAETAVCPIHARFRRFLILLGVR
jgi:hypothetical protein